QQPGVLRRAPLELRVLEARQDVVDVRLLGAPVLELVPVTEEVRREPDAREVVLDPRVGRDHQELPVRPHRPAPRSTTTGASAWRSGSLSLRESSPPASSTTPRGPRPSLQSETSARRSAS